MYQGSVEAGEHCYARGEPLPHSSRTIGVICDTVPRTLALGIELVVAQEDLVELLEDLDAWFVRIEELLLSLAGYLVILVLYVLKEV